MNFIEDKPNVSGGRIQKKDACINKGQHQEGAGTFTRKSLGRRTNIWRIPIGKNPKTQGHPAPFPEQLAHDHIITWSNPGDVICDPFLGSGTTAAVAVKTDRHYIGFEISPQFLRLRVNVLMMLKEKKEKMDIDTIFNQDCLVGLKTLPDKSIDLILTDPPYGKKADKGTNGFGAAKNRRYTGGWDGMIPP